LKNIELKQMMNETQKKMLEVLDKGTHHITNNNNIKNKFNFNPLGNAGIREGQILRQQKVKSRKRRIV
jgi:hypothetical protein